MLESLIDLLKGGKPSKIVWTADLAYWIDSRPEKQIKENSWDTEIGHLQLARQLGCVPYYYYGKFWAFESTSDKFQVSTETQGNTQRRIWSTPAGQLCEESRFVEQSKSQAITKYPIENAEDLKTLIFILDNSEKVPANIDDYPQRRELWAGYDGLPCLGLPRSPLPAFLVEWTGVQTGVYLLMDRADLVHEVLQLLQVQEQPIVDALCRLQPPLVHFPDNLTGETFTGFFDEYMLPCYEQRLAKLHPAGIKTAVHLDGTVRGILPKLAAVGIDAIEALTPKPAGDTDVERMRSLAADEGVILWGGVPGAMFSQPYDWEDMKRHLDKTLNAWQSTPFVLGVADQVPPDGDITMVTKISDFVKNRRP